ncbi:tyrosyl-tRNA synthetase [Exophiala xenobiotica]|nr:tyrosyl-tRNA synthetase [Exophiala xenobiotica]KAK5408761.1 tyrosyl-tRNA synthetase [Exophiala xenobiotica]KAK5473982.1 tyrosyl-tRNA synthetase [Exophiala xenobiotica]
MSTNNPVQAVRRSLYVCRSCRQHLRASNISQPAFANPQPRRWISRNHVRKIQEAEEEWRTRAQDIESGRMQSLLTTLEERGYINQIVGSKEDLNKLMIHRRVGVYAGIDPTAPSMHVGHMVPFMVLAWFYIHGYDTHFVLGGFTASIGDPTGRTTGREIQSAPTRKANIASMHAQLKRLGASIERYAQRRGFQKEWAWRRALENNSTWWNATSARDYLSILGRQIRIGPLLGRDTVKTRLERGDGMSYAEFSYPLVQAWDWWHLFQKGVQIQVGGGDQFGNILAGAEAVKQLAKDSHEYQSALRQTTIIDKKYDIDVTSDPLGITVPLLTTASGEKFGKSAGNAVWLEPKMTPIFDLYQFFLRSADADVEKYLKLFTFLSLPEIAETVEAHEKDPSQRIAQHKLAREFVELIYGEDAAAQAEQEHRQLFKKTLSINDITSSVSEAKATEPWKATQSPTADFTHPSLNKHAAPLRMEDNMSTHVKLPRSLVLGKPLGQIMFAAGMVSSKAEGHRLIRAGGAYVGNGGNGAGDSDSLTYRSARTNTAEEAAEYIIDEKLLVLRVGKWKMKIVEIVSDEEYEQAGLTCPAWELKKAEEAEAGEVQTEAEDGKPAVARGKRY